MRAIKFRIWDNLKKEWVSNKGIWRIKTDDAGIGEIDPPMVQWKQHPEGLLFQQFTGLKDHKEVECYEGDIVRYFPLPPFEVSTGIIGEVVFNQGSFAIRVTDKKFGGAAKYNVYFHDDGIEYFEVVGNIYEHPELLQ